jgi:hypothetical protein
MSGAAEVDARRRAGAPDCLRCRAYYVTHEPLRPHGCRSFGFRSARLPRDEVRLSSGAECAAFEPKPLPSGATRAPGT